MDNLPGQVLQKICGYLAPLKQREDNSQDSSPSFNSKDINEAALVSKKWNFYASSCKWKSLNLFSLNRDKISRVNSNYRLAVKELVINNYDSVHCEKALFSYLFEFIKYEWPRLESVKIYAGRSKKVVLVTLQFLKKNLKTIKHVSVYDGLEVAGLYSVFLDSSDFRFLSSIKLINSYDSRISHNRAALFSDFFGRTPHLNVFQMDGLSLTRYDIFRLLKIAQTDTEARQFVSYFPNYQNNNKYQIVIPQIDPYFPQKYRGQDKNV
ncbi:hypothetical protein BB560_002434 [Smittium megazygosporum]|uniref:F-box domain-containing protein n=1 Tax=Smittium megazygosporum TaxID=133381 RepID=A0A2T9ZES7_9FUNG|nr:hypothetical protein BB560_002434 [Smittium megazygosporum]